MDEMGLDLGLKLPAVGVYAGVQGNSWWESAEVELLRSWPVAHRSELLKQVSRQQLFLAESMNFIVQWHYFIVQWHYPVALLFGDTLRSRMQCSVHHC